MLKKNITYSNNLSSPSSCGGRDRGMEVSLLDYRQPPPPPMNKQRRAFTLMELMLVLGILGILAVIVLVAINPTKQLGEARGANRHASVREIENAVIQYIIDGNSLAGIPAGKVNAQDICRTGISGACYELAILSPTYLVFLPVDPDETDPDLTGYRIYTLGSFLKVCSPRVDTDCGT